MTNKETRAVEIVASLTNGNQVNWELEDFGNASFYFANIGGCSYVATPNQLMMDGMPISDNGSIFNLINN